MRNSVLSRWVRAVGTTAAACCLLYSGVASAQQWNTSGSNIYNTNTGNVGIGTSSPQSILHIAGPSGVNTVTFNTPGTDKFRFGTIQGIVNWGALVVNAAFTYPSGWTLDDTTANGWFLKLDTRGANGNSSNNGFWVFRIPNGAGFHTDESPLFGVTSGSAWFGQSVGIGTTPGAAPDSTLQVVGTGHFTGNVTVDGNIAAKYQDVAEWVETSEKLASGAVVVLDPELPNHVMASSKPYDTSVAGVVSASPGVILGEGSSSKEKIATTGRVKVRVDATKSPIRIGDLLVTSAEPGTAMKSEPMNVAGVQLHRPGTIVGKALEPLPSGRGEILVLLSLQ